MSLRRRCTSTHRGDHPMRCFLEVARSRRESRRRRLDSRWSALARRGRGSETKRSGEDIRGRRSDDEGSGDHRAHPRSPSEGSGFHFVHRRRKRAYFHPGREKSVIWLRESRVGRGESGFSCPPSGDADWEGVFAKKASESTKDESRLSSFSSRVFEHGEPLLKLASPLPLKRSRLCVRSLRLCTTSHAKEVNSQRVASTSSSTPPPLSAVYLDAMMRRPASHPLAA